MTEFALTEMEMVAINVVTIFVESIETGNSELVSVAEQKLLEVHDNNSEDMVELASILAKMNAVTIIEEIAATENDNNDEAVEEEEYGNEG